MSLGDDQFLKVTQLFIFGLRSPEIERERKRKRERERREEKERDRSEGAFL